MKFKEYNKFNLSDINQDVLKKWDEEQVFAKSIEEREGAPVSYTHLTLPTTPYV